MPKYVVQSGDCISSLAEENGLLWQTIWDHPENAELKAKRQDPNILLPGDEVFIPAIELRLETRPVDGTHKFVKKGVPAKLRIRIMKAAEPAQGAAPRGTSGQPGSRHFEAGDPEAPEPQPDEPRSNTPYVLDIDGKLTDGQTDGDGYIEIKIPPRAKNGNLKLDPGTSKETVIPLQLGHLDPIDEISGVKQRLAHLGLDCGDTANEANDKFRAAVAAFQQAQGLPVNGELDEKTRSALKNVHGS